MLSEGIKSTAVVHPRTVTGVKTGMFDQKNPGLVAHYQTSSGTGQHELLVLVRDGKKAYEILEPFLDA